MKKTVTAALMVGAAVFAGGVVCLPEAHAALSQCATNNACGWIDQNYVRLSVSRNATAYAVVNQLPDNDQITAIANKGTKHIGWYTDAKLSGSRYCETNKDNNPNVGKSWNDKFSSLIVYGDAKTC